MTTPLASGRALSQWRGMVPQAVVDGSPAQTVIALTDARRDILALADEVERLRRLGGALYGAPVDLTEIRRMQGLQP